MSELAFDKEGNPFRFSRRTKKLRPRRWKNAGQRGTCAAVLDPDGEPLFLDADAEFVDFRAAVGNVPGFYRLDQCDEDGTPIEDVPPAYVSIESTRNAAPLGDVDPRDAIIRDLAQINADVTRTIAERFSNVMQAAADILRAADGAGLSRRTPPPPAPAPTPEHDADDEDDEHESEDEESEPMPPANPFGPLQPLVEMAMPHLPKFGAFLWVKFQEFMRQNVTPPPVAATHAAPAPEYPPAAATTTRGPEPVGTAGPSAAAASPAPTPPSSPPVAAPPTSMPIVHAAPAGGAATQPSNVAPPPPALASEHCADVMPAADGAASAAFGPSVVPPPVAPSPEAPPPSAAPSAPPSTAPADAPRNAPPAPMTEQWAHLRAILARLSPREAAITESVLGRMPPEVRMSWLAELSALGVDQAVEALRSMIPAKPQAAEPAAAGISTMPPAIPATKPRVPTEPTTSEAPATAPEAPPRPAKQGSAAPTNPTTAVQLPASPHALEHFLAIQAALTPEEAAFVRAAVCALSPPDLNALLDELSAMSVSEAVDRVSALLAEARQAGAA